MSMVEVHGMMILVCDSCGLVIGQEVYFNGRKLLKLETTFVYCHHGFCICGAQVHWDARDVIYRRLMKHLGKDG